jgi:hypothetical protein
MPRPPSNGISNLSDQPFVTMGGGALPLPMPTQPETLTATRVATKAMSTFLHWSSPFFTPRDAHFVPRCTIGRPLPSMVHRFRRQWGTSKETVSLGTQLGARYSFAACFSAGSSARCSARPSTTLATKSAVAILRLDVRNWWKLTSGGAFKFHRPGLNPRLTLHPAGTAALSSKGRRTGPCSRPMVTWLTP